MSPEQTGGHSRLVDPRSDIYSLGLTLYELIALQAAFPAKERSQLFQQIASQDPPRLRQLAPSTPRDLETIVSKAIAKTPQSRYQTAGEFAEDLRRFLDDKPVRARPPRFLETVNKWRRRNRALVATSIVTLLLAFVVAGGLLFRERRATLAALASEKQQRSHATAESRKALDAKTLATHQRDTAVSNQYHAEIVSGHVDWERGYLERLHRKLCGHLPLAGERDLRGWEWYFLFSLCHPEKHTLHLPYSAKFAAWSSDGECIGGPGSIWRAGSGEMLRTLTPSNILSARCTWSPDGQRFAWGMVSDDSCIYVWDRQTDELRELRGHKESVWCVAWSPDGQQLASGGIDREVWIWDINSGKKINALAAGDYVTDVAWSPDGKLLAAGVKRDQLKVWEIATGDVVSHLTGLGTSSEPHLAQLAWDPEGEQLAISTPQRWSLIRRSDWQVVRQQDMLQARGSDIAWRPDGQRIAVADGETISIWRPEAEAPEQTLRGHLQAIGSVAWSPDGQQLVSAAAGETRIWDLHSPLQPPVISTKGPLKALAWGRDNLTLLTTGAADGAVSLWETRTGQYLRTDSAVAEGRFFLSPNRRLIACLPTGRETPAPEIRILTAQTGEPHAVLRGDVEDRIHELAWSSDSRLLALRRQSHSGMTIEVWVVDSEKRLCAWSYPRGKLHPGFRSPMAFSSDGRRLAVSLQGEDGDDGATIWHGHVYILDVATGGAELKRKIGEWGHRSEVASLAWSPSGEQLVMGSRDGVIEAVAIPSGRSVFSSRLHSTAVNALAWSPDGQRIACGAQDGSVKILASQGGGDLLTFMLEKGVTHLAWSADGQRLAAATSEGDVHVWDASRGYEYSDKGPRRGELAWIYYQRSRPDEADAYPARLQEVLKLAPDSRAFWELRGHARARLGDFDGAAAEFAKAIEPGLERVLNAGRYRGYALLAAGDIDGYGRHRETLLNAYQNTRVPSTGARIAWECSLLPDRRIDTQLVLRLARENCEANQQDSGHENLLTLAAALYRSGFYEEAARELAELNQALQRTNDPTKAADRAYALYFLAMARHQLGHRFQSQRYLNEAVETAAGLLTDTHWTTRVGLCALDKEARGLLGISS